MPKVTPVHGTILEKVFLSDGWRFHRQEGSHRSYVKPGVARPIVTLAEEDRCEACKKRGMNRG